MTEVAAVEAGPGEQFLGVAIGRRTEVAGPLAVCTAAFSPLSEICKPEYRGAIVVFTTPHISGTAAELARAVAAAVVVREPDAALSGLLARAGLPGVAEADTRALTRLVSGAAGVVPGRIRQFPGEEA